MVPNVNEAAHGLNGKLLPFGWLKLLYRLKIKQVKSGRILLMGVRKEYRRTKIGLAMAASLSANIFKQARQRGYRDVEMSWILESNKSMIRIIKLGQGKLYKTYRIFQKDIN
jgi:GNAT superfamily N-acetyltransferase